MTNNILNITHNSIINEDISGVAFNNIHQIDLKKEYNVLITWANGMLPSYLLYYFQWLNIISDNKFQIYLIIRNNENRINIINDLSNIHILWRWAENPINTDIKFDYIIHAWSDATPKKYINNKIGTINTNVKWLYNLLELDLSNLKSFFFFTTWELYWTPDAKDIPIKEDYIWRINHLNERSAYVETKRFCETLLINYYYEKKLPVKMVRPFHTFWPGIDLEDWRVFSDFIKSAYNLEDIVINWDWTTTRSFCYLADALDMYVKILFSDINWEVYNVWNPNNEISIKDLAQIICEIVDYKISYKILWKDNWLAPLKSNCDISKWIKNLWFNPKFSVREGFSRTLESLSKYS